MFAEIGGGSGGGVEGLDDACCNFGVAGGPKEKGKNVGSNVM